MPVSKEKKKEIYNDVTTALVNSGSVVFVKFHGITVAHATSLRKKLKAEQVNYLVAKKSIVKKVLGEQKNITGTLPVLDGELALAYSKDLVSPAREIYAFQKTLDGKVSIEGGIFEGAYMSKEAMIAVATIPSTQTLHAMFVNVINSPIQGFVLALDAIAKKKA